MYLHCDHTANGYLRQLLDSVFGRDNLRNEIIWQYRTGGIGRRWFARKHDTIFFYSKTSDYQFTLPREESRDPRRFNKTDEEGRRYYEKAGNRLLRGRGRRGGGCLGHPDGTQRFRRVHGLPHPEADLPRGAHHRRQLRTGAIRCSTALPDARTQAIAAERLGRNWVTCDMNPRAWTVLKRQFQKPKLHLLQCNDETTGQAVLGNEPVVTVHGPNQLPLRTSPILTPSCGAAEADRAQVQSACQHHSRSGNASEIAGVQRLSSLVLRFRESTP